MPVTASAIAGTLSTVTSTITGISDVKKRREIESALQRLSYNDQKKLNEQMAKTSSQNQRLAMLVEAVSNVAIAESQAAQSRQTRNALIIIGGSLVFLVIIIYLKKRK